jgi:hypothetical protein
MLSKLRLAGAGEVYLGVHFLKRLAVFFFEGNNGIME